MEAVEDNFEFVSISTLAKRLGVSGQTIRNRIKEGLYETLTFKRGGMNGTLIKVPIWNDLKDEEKQGNAKL
jgi:transcriptional antiterminator